MENLALIKLSIIVPIYGVELYLCKCVDSLLAQDLSSSEYEIILIDDESPDACPQICDDYVATHENIRVVHRKNGGLSVARNSGIEVAKGDYLMFVDSDDYIEPNVLKGLMTQIERDNLDVLRYRLQYVNPQYEVYNPYKSDSFCGNDYSSEPTDGVSFLNTRMSTACYAWAFILRRDLIISTPYATHLSHKKDDCLFSEGIFFEDSDWTPRMLIRAQRVASTNTVVYNYLQREGSITKAVNRSKQKKVLDDKIRLISEMQRQAEELEDKGMDNRWFSRMIADTVISVIGILSKDFYREKKAYLSHLKQMSVYPIQSNTTKAKLINLSPCLAAELLHLKNG